MLNIDSAMAVQGLRERMRSLLGTRRVEVEKKYARKTVIIVRAQGDDTYPSRPGNP